MTVTPAPGAVPIAAGADGTSSSPIVEVHDALHATLILAHEGDEREACVEELKGALQRYLEPVAGTS